MRLVSQLDCRSSETSSILVRGAKCRAAHGGQPVSKSGEQRSIRWLGAKGDVQKVPHLRNFARVMSTVACRSSKPDVSDRSRARALTSDSSSGRGRLPLEQATRVRFPHRTPYPCRWIRRQVYEASREGSIPSRGATNCPRPRNGRRPSEGRYVEVRLLAGAPPAWRNSRLAWLITKRSPAASAGPATPTTFGTGALS
jgi:hypothetical protein